ncbi:MAG: wax ester/triacylglycerol synthase family O-acyltransferase [Deltaproteobacteria bacterium]|nr:wax ester/triacylglycerol synthase family O-acyltransferase [Deltaproteobacteria bacterium]MBW2415060.1 wax ester/triacylglycerol synthase family O-acyltransferase [Deltaproteobacteria bacterium]
MSDVRYEDWMSDNDAMMWHIERDPLLRSTVMSVWVLDRVPDPARFEQTLTAAVAAIPRLRQRVVSDGWGIAPPRWEIDPHFDAAYHVRHVRVGGEGSVRDLLDLAAPISMQAFDKDRPLWEFWLVDGLENGRSGVILKLHHAVSDGVGLVRMTETMVERSRDADPHSLPADTAPLTSEPRSESDHLRDALRHRASVVQQRTGALGRALGRGLGTLARDPLGTGRRAVDTATSIGRLLRPVSEPLSTLMVERSLSTRFDTLTFPFAELKAAAKKVDGTLNDAFVGSVAGGLQRYHAALGAPVDELRMSMPINLREGDKARQAGNQFVPARFAVPIGIADPAERLRTIHRLVKSQRAEPALPLTEEITAVLTRLGTTASTALAGSMMKALDFVTSNVPGPRFPVYASGAKIEHMFPFGPCAGAAVNVTLFSYDGQLQVGINSDRAAVREPQLLVECMEKGFAEVLSIA